MSLSARQQRLRATGVSASEVAAVVGLSRWQRPIDVWAAKTGRGADEDKSSYASRLGTQLEDPIAKVWAEEHGRYLARVDTLRHPTKPLALATPDRAVYVQRPKGRGLRRWVQDAEALLEVKSTNWRLRHLWGAEGTDAIPEEYLIQCHWQGAVAGLPTVEVAVDVDKTELRSYRVVVSHEVFEALYEQVERFWADYVLAGRPPAPDASAAYQDWLRRAHPRHVEGPLAQATSEDEDAASRYYVAGKVAEVAAATRQLARNQLVARIGDAPGLEGPFGRLSYRASKEGQRTDWEAVARELEGVLRLANTQRQQEGQGLLVDTAEVVARHTTVRPGVRSLRATWAPEWGRPLVADDVVRLLESEHDDQVEEP